jgi:mono/diheme cytochrome c family protein
MAKKGWIGIAAAAALVLCVAVSAQSESKDKVERGRYLVEEIGKCQDCHTPRLDSGQPDRTKWLQGASIDFKPTHPVPKWEEMSPGLTRSGLSKKWGEAGVAKFLETGVGPDGDKADAPMPLYKMKHEDAAAIAAYLNSLE